MNALQEFVLNENMRESVRSFLLEKLEDSAKKAVFAREDVSGYPEAHKIINKAFREMKRMAPKNDEEESRFEHSV